MAEGVLCNRSQGIGQVLATAKGCPSDIFAHPHTNQYSPCPSRSLATFLFNVAHHCHRLGATLASSAPLRKRLWDFCPPLQLPTSCWRYSTFRHTQFNWIALYLEHQNTSHVSGHVWCRVSLPPSDDVQRLPFGMISNCSVDALFLFSLLSSTHPSLFLLPPSSVPIISSLVRARSFFQRFPSTWSPQWLVPTILVSCVCTCTSTCTYPSLVSSLT